MSFISVLISASKFPIDLRLLTMHGKVGTNTHPSTGAESPEVAVSFLACAFVDALVKPTSVIKFLRFWEDLFIAMKRVRQRCDTNAPWQSVRANLTVRIRRLAWKRTGKRSMQSQCLHKHGMEGWKSVESLGVGDATL